MNIAAVSPHFVFDATDALKVGDTNVIAVKVNNAYKRDIPAAFRGLHIFSVDVIVMCICSSPIRCKFLRSITRHPAFI